MPQHNWRRVPWLRVGSHEGPIPKKLQKLSNPLGQEKNPQTQGVYTRNHVQVQEMNK